MLHSTRFYQIASRATVTFFGFFMLAVAFWANKFFGNVSIDQLIYTFIFSLNGSLKCDPIFLKRFVMWCIFVPCCLTTLLVYLQYFNRYSNFLFSKVHNFIVITGIIVLSHQFMVLDFIRHSFGPDYFNGHYRDPRMIQFKSSNHPKNLVMIYVESLENTYSNSKIFGRDLLGSLDSIKKNAVSFPRYVQVPGTSWSIAGIVATQCGIPLKSLSVFDANRNGQAINHFLPNAKCLSDILSDNGYYNVFMNGSSLDFGGLRLFLKEHHYHEMIGKEEWLSAPQTAPLVIGGWGLPDDALMNQAKNKYIELMHQNKRFNLTVFTIDTHGPDGFLNRKCRAAGFHNFTGIVQCTADEVADFVKFIKSHDPDNQVNVVIVGDHLAMENPVSNQLTKTKHRYAFNMMLTTHHFQTNSNSIVPFDMFPTILDSLGFSYNGHLVALGYSGISADKIPYNRKRIHAMKKQIANQSRIYNELWLTAKEH